MPPITRSAPALAAALWLTAAALPCPALEHDWQFAPQHWEGKTLKAAKGDLKLVAAQEPDLYKTELKLGGEQLMWAEGVDPASLPQEKITVEAWLSLEKTQKWGGIAGFLQDNGSYERGWLLGYSDNGFTFWLSTGGPLMMLESPRGIVPGEPVHVAGVYDGASIKLYVGGKLEAQRAASGPIAYPDAAFYTLGAYKDANESYPMAGGTLRRVRVLDSALSEAEIRRHAGLREPLDFEIEPSVLFTGPGKARVEWLAGPPGSGTVGFGTSRALGSTARAFGGKMAGSGALSYAELENLEPDTKYYFRVAGLGGRLSEVMEFHTGFAFRAPTAGQPGDAAARGIGEYLSRELKAGAGMVVLLGDCEPRLARQIVDGTQFRVVWVLPDEARVKARRAELYPTGLYGSRISCLHVPDLEALPFTSGFAGAVIGQPGVATTAEARRILRPGGVAAVLDKTNRVFPVGQRGYPEGVGAWSHQYADPGNTAGSADALGGAAATGDLALQWVGRPGGDFGIDRQSRMPAPLSAGPVLIHQGMNRIVALDAYSGVPLWSREIPALRRINLPRDCGNACLWSDRLYLAVGDRLWGLKAGTGEFFHAAPVIGNSGGEFQWGYVGALGDRMVGSAVKRGAAFDAFWGKDAWFDEKAGGGAAKVGSDALFSFNLLRGGGTWRYTGGVILNPTIALAGDSAYFVECRNPSVAEGESRRLSGPEIWKDQFLVALDIQTGAKRWEQPLDTEDGTAAFYLQVSGEKILITSSRDRYYLYCFNAGDGAPLWQAANAWPDDHHSGHIQHPVIAGDKIYLQPNGYDLATGEVFTRNVGERSGCHTYVGAGNALLYRGAGRQVAMWDMATEKVTAWDRLRPSCWLSVVPAGGLVLVPEGGGGCSCGGWMETSLALIPRSRLSKTGLAPFPERPELSVPDPATGE